MGCSRAAGTAAPVIHSASTKHTVPATPNTTCGCEEKAGQGGGGWGRAGWREGGQKVQEGRVEEGWQIRYCYMS